MIGGRGRKKKSLSSLCSARHTQEITFMCSDWLVWLGLSESSIEQLQAFCAFGCVAFFFPSPVPSVLYYDSTELLFHDTSNQRQQVISGHYYSRQRHRPQSSGDLSA